MGREIRILLECEHCGGGGVLRRLDWPEVYLECHTCGKRTSISITFVEKTKDIIRPADLPSSPEGVDSGIYR